ncbi:hypothetical protein POTOM_004161 [Populus tomentosa]|uniref:Uncharacterized protein n=1 Tax=Populus tomentosa TaxID=118781 RepID=A0A8X8DDH4_POPTO|nr:hypothetical protein POTOM_004161 [Populus tomentosa]
MLAIQKWARRGLLWKQLKESHVWYCALEVPFLIDDFILHYCIQKRKKSEKKISRSIKRIKADMVEISEGQKRIREGQREVREKFQEISEEAAKLKEETHLISKQSAANELRLHLMFQIIKARAENDYAKDALLTQNLRFVILQINPCACV